MCFAGGTVDVVSMGLDAELAAVNEFALCLSDEERLRASRFVFERDRCRFIVGRARLRYLLASRLGVQPDAIELIYGAHGKPALSRRFAGSDLRFNVSHSEGVAVYAFSPLVPLGPVTRVLNNFGHQPAALAMATTRRILKIEDAVGLHPNLDLDRTNGLEQTFCSMVRRARFPAAAVVH